MTPVLGIIASANQQGRGGGPVGAYDALATINIPSGGVASVTFAGIPSGYKDLQLRVLARTTRASSLDNLWINFNGDAGNNYYSHRFEGDGSSIYADGFGLSGQPTAFLVPTAANLANVFCGGIMDIIDYSSTTKNKTLRTMRGFDMNGTGYITLGGILWMPSTIQAITSITLASGNSANIAEYSSLALYGVK